MKSWAITESFPRTEKSFKKKRAPNAKMRKKLKTPPVRVEYCP
jgi:hypothetical protein